MDAPPCTLRGGVQGSGLHHATSTVAKKRCCRIRSHGCPARLGEVMHQQYMLFPACMGDSLFKHHHFMCSNQMHCATATRYSQVGQVTTRRMQLAHASVGLMRHAFVAAALGSYGSRATLVMTSSSMICVLLLNRHVDCSQNQHVCLPWVCSGPSVGRRWAPWQPLHSDHYQYDLCVAAAAAAAV
jgi:hypothetical protein